MSLIISPLRELESYRELSEGIRKNNTPVLATGVTDSQKCHLAYALMNERQCPAVIVTYSELYAKEIFEDMQFFLHEKIKFYPSKDILFYNADVRSLDIERHRLGVMDSLIKGEDISVVMSVEALLCRLTPKDIFKGFVLEYQVGDEVSLNELTESLVHMGYERTDGVVEGPGQFALRGGILDIYTTIYENALRLEFWGDEIDSIRLLDTFSQRSIEKINRIRIFPIRELVYGEEELNRAAAAIEKEFKTTEKKYLAGGRTEEAEQLSRTINEVLEKLRETKSFSGVENFIKYFYDEETSILEYMPENTLLFFDEPQRITEHVGFVLEEFNESVKNRILKGHLLPGQTDMVFSYGQILHKHRNMPTVLLAAFTHQTRDFSIKELVSFSVKSTGTFKQRFDLLLDDLKYWMASDYRVVILSGSTARGRRITEEILNAGLPAKYYDDPEGVEPERGRIIITHGSLNKGFEYQQINFVVVSDKELFGQEKQKARKRKKKRAAIESFTDLQVGDYIVHDNHGIGIYKGIEQVDSGGGVIKDYLKLQYSDGGVLYVHTNQMDLIQKYIGGEGAKLRLNKLGGSEWGKARARAKKAVTILAKDLVELYAARESSTGFAYSEDTVWQREFEELFPFEETEDQLGAIEDVKRDMETSRVMDRLICGDVGYGKTEVAIRAAFKAVQDGKQVAYLVPTTILAQQHFNTFVQRMANFPISVEMLSRFRTPKQRMETIKRLKSGMCDIVIGTHRILSKDIGFKDLGLVIVDEEQRFGVGHKEKLKKLKENVDVMTLSATPIPRTLHMSLTGIRDMSVLEEPPLERQPVQTYVMEYNQEFVRDAINRELARGGQVYYLHNRVRNIKEVAARVQKLVPEAVVGYAHGQMSERELENIMIDFINGDVNVLVCTTIIETGLDIPNVNTIIINDADFMGLAQLYQLRGRVGRANRQAYAYLMYRKDKVLQEFAEKRLQTIKEFTEFGSGFKIAMRDMEIRGAGNLLGGEQHGHMDAIGYDMYCKLLAEAVGELQGADVSEEFETAVDFNINAHLSPDYIENEEQRLEIYKKISLIKNDQDYNEMQEEIEDRYGDIPKPAQTLLDVALLKAAAHRLGILSVTHRGSVVEMRFRPGAEVDPMRLMDVVSRNRHRLTLAAGANVTLTYRLNVNENNPKPMEIKLLLDELSYA